jgi:hypothetical protein
MGGDDEKRGSIVQIDKVRRNGSPWVPSHLIRRNVDERGWAS